MARKTKEKLEELDKKETSKKAPKTVKKLDPVVEKNSEETKKVAAKKSTSKSTTKTVAKKSATATVSANKSATTKASTKKSTTTKASAKKSATATVDVEAPAKKTTATKKPTTKKTTTKSTVKSTTRKPSTKKTPTKSAVKKVSSTKSNSEVTPIVPMEYYDLPYRYNETVVKVLAQNPNTLFAYWDISDGDIKHFEELYGKTFFYNTRPVLIVYNLTDNYTFEIDIDDFANNWYIHVDNTKCKYLVELGRRPKYEYHEDIPVNYLNIAFSNAVEIPNDHILFFKENDRIYFKNIKTNKITEKIFKSKNDVSIVKGIYKNYNLRENEDRFDFKNPSSNNPTSNVF